MYHVLNRAEYHSSPIHQRTRDVKNVEGTSRIHFFKLLPRLFPQSACSTFSKKTDRFFWWFVLWRGQGRSLPHVHVRVGQPIANGGSIADHENCMRSHVAFPMMPEFKVLTHFKSANVKPARDDFLETWKYIKPELYVVTYSLFATSAKGILSTYQKFFQRPNMSCVVKMIKRDIRYGARSSVGACRAWLVADSAIEFMSLMKHILLNLNHSLMLILSSRIQYEPCPQNLYLSGGKMQVDGMHFRCPFPEFDSRHRLRKSCLENFINFR